MSIVIEIAGVVSATEKICVSLGSYPKDAGGCRNSRNDANGVALTGRICAILMACAAVIALIALRGETPIAAHAGE
jgi:hypothetical protein